MFSEFRLIKPEGNSPLLSSRHSWGDNIKVNLKEVMFEGVDCIRVTQNTSGWWSFVNMVVNLWFS
jgi:hypothetical protein